MDAELTLLVTDSDGRVLDSVGEVDTVQRIASVGKLLLLSHVAKLIDTGALDGAALLRRDSTEFVADSGLWQHLDAEQLSVVDCCRLVGAVSDNLAANVLLERVGIDAVAAHTADLGVAPYALLDLIRNERGPGLPHTCAEGSATSLVRFLRLLERGVVSSRVRDWMRLNTDLSMAAGHLQLDPLAHVDETPLLHNKTGTDDGVRVDVGTLVVEGRTVHYCAMLHWPAGEPMDPAAFAALRAFGARIERAAHSTV
ncbi:serine hydrolase [Yimella sp. cx-51]|uniref:serine hydrolase n=1 Tax=Yimella sp. cx-51 TaxID=2770551 RepID=UPI00165D32B4|nr:serine hydrolase [Yimella sp. cx-51]MBC9955840.1 serine hydrolase [Yimella sp. cx-51]QTH37611.1 serine hydrolase [Yimella sp. cx-51]